MTTARAARPEVRPLGGHEARDQPLPRRKRAIMKILLASIAIAAAAVGGVTTPAEGASQPAGASARTAPAPADYVFPRGLPWAPTDSECYAYRCVWDAKHQGNGEGLSLILTRFHGDYIPKEIFHRRAHRLQAAYCARKNVTCEGYTD